MISEILSNFLGKGLKTTTTKKQKTKKTESKGEGEVLCSPEEEDL